jgi:hypothetical protein
MRCDVILVPVKPPNLLSPSFVDVVIVQHFPTHNICFSLSLAILVCFLIPLYICRGQVGQSLELILSLELVVVSLQSSPFFL